MRAAHRVHPVTGRARTIIDTIADNAADAGIILGGGRVRARRRRHALDRRDLLLQRTSSRRPVLAAGVLGHPANGIAWVARRLAPYGMAIEAGQIILAGSFTRATATRPATISWPTTGHWACDVQLRLTRLRRGYRKTAQSPDESKILCSA